MQRLDISPTLNATGRDTVIGWNGHGLTSMARLLHDTNAKLERRRISEVYREMDQRHSLFTSQLALSVTENVIPDQEILRDPSNA